MIHEAANIVTSRVAVVEAVTPSPELPPGEASVPAPTSEQAQAADHIFTTTSSHPHPAATLMGVLTSAMLLRDIAVDTFDTSGEEEEETPEKKPDDKDADPTSPRP
jgi:hypothetical protein